MKHKWTMLLVGSLLAIGVLTEVFGLHLALAANKSDVLISEVLYDPPGTCGTDQRAEWVELYNNSGSTISLSGWELCDNTSCDPLPDTPVVPGEGLIIAAYETEFKNCYGCSSGHIHYLGGYIGGGLSNDGDRMYILDDSSTRIDEMSYGSDTTFFTLAGVSEGHSLHRNSYTDADTAADWRDQSSPSPCLGPNAITLSAFTASVVDGFGTVSLWPLAALVSAAALTLAGLLWAKQRRLV